MQLLQRISALEVALAEMQSTVSTERHPLLQTEIALDEQRGVLGSSTSMDEQLASTTAAFGTLAIGKTGESAYFGSTAGSEALILVCFLRDKFMIYRPSNRSARKSHFAIRNATRQ